MRADLLPVRASDFQEELEAARSRLATLEKANRAIQESLDRIARLSVFSQGLEQSASIDDVSQLLFEEVECIFPASVMALALQEGDAQEYRIQHVSRSSMREMARKELEAQAASGVFEWALGWRRPTMVSAALLGDQMILMPLATARRAVGMLMVGTRLPAGEVEQEHLTLAGVVARQAAECIDNLSLTQDLRRQNEAIQKAGEAALARRVADLGLLVETARTISGPLELDAVLQLLVEATCRHLDVRMVGISLLGTDGGLPFATGVGLPTGCLRCAEVCGEGGGLVGVVAAMREPVMVPDIWVDPRNRCCDTGRQVGLESYLGVPLVGRERVVGVLSVMTDTPRPFNADEVALLTGLGAQGALAIENARLYDGLRCRIEEQQRALARLVQSTRMASVGLVAGGVAHDINNPLCVISNYVQLLRLRPEGLPSDVAAGLEAIESNVRRIDAKIQILLEYTRGNQDGRRATQINEVVQRMLLLLQNHSLFRRLRIATDLVPGLPTVALDRAAWEHVILELLTNAQEAMPDGGSVRISTRLLSGECRLQTPRGYPDCGLEEPGDPNRKSQIENRKSAGCVEVIVKDDGPGIAPENLRQIFDPFFTTKGAGRGMGLGLRVCRDIVANHGGRLRVESDGKRGTRVVIELPLSKESHDGAGSNGRGNGDALLDTLGF